MTDIDHLAYERGWFSLTTVQDGWRVTDWSATVKPLTFATRKLAIAAIDALDAAVEYGGQHKLTSEHEYQRRIAQASLGQEVQS